MIMEKKLTIAICARPELYDSNSFIIWNRPVKETAWGKICKICTTLTFFLPTVRSTSKQSKKKKKKASPWLSRMNTMG